MVEVQLRTPQAFIGVDVADARDESLVEQKGLDGTPRGTHPGDDTCGTGELQGRIEQVASDMRGVGRQQRLRAACTAGGAVDGGGQVDDMQAAEHALVNQVENRPVGAVGTRVTAEMDTYTQVARRGRDVSHVAGPLGGTQVHRAPAEPGVRVHQEGRGAPDSRVSVGGCGGTGAAHEQLAAHAQVGRQGASVVQGQPQELTAPHGRGHGASGELVDKGPYSPVLTAQRTRVEDLDTGNGASGHVPGESGTHHLDLGELGHQLFWVVCWVSRSARRASLTPGRSSPPSPRAARMAA